MGETMIDPKTLTDVSVRIEAKDLEDLSTTHQVNDLELDQNGELLIPIRIPARLAQLSVTLSGKVDGLADGKEQTLQTSRQWDIAGIRHTSHTHDAFLTRDRDDFVVEVRGRNGELVPRATVVVALTTEIRNAPVEQTLQSDDNGRVRMGKLSGVTQIRFSVPSGLEHHRDLELDQVRWADEIHTTSDRVVQLPLVDDREDLKTRYRLLEVRGGSYFADHSDHLAAGDGLLTIKTLEPGDYQLLDRTKDEQTLIAVVEGPTIGLVATGQTRHRSVSPAVPLGIASITHDQEGLTDQAFGEDRRRASSFVRVAVPRSSNADRATRSAVAAFDADEA